MSYVVDRFIVKFDELNLLTVNLMQNETAKKAVSDFNDILIDAYIEGIAAAAYIMGEDIDIDENRLKRALNKEYNGQSIQDKLIEYYFDGDITRAKTLIDSEFHRVYNTALFEGAKESGARTKTWVTVGDDKVRDTHYYLEGVTIPIDAEFITYTGDRALYPSGFESAEENANCRCILDFSR